MIIKFLKPFSFLPAILLMYMIFSFSAQDGTASADLSYQVSYKIVEVGGEVLGADLQPWEVDQLATRFHIPVRKLAHMTEYFLLAVAVAFPLYVYGLRGILLLICAGVICVAFACGDEYHQAFVDGRGPSKRDVLIDSVGVFFGIVLVRIIGWTGRNTIFRPFARKKKQESAATADPYMADQRRTDPRMNASASYVPDPRMNDSRMNNPYMQDPRMADTHRTDPRMNASYVPDPRSYYHEPYPADRQDPNYYNPNYYEPNYHNPNYYEPNYRDPYYNDFNEDSYPEEESTGTSDRLSEDMSFRKLMSDLKNQKQTRSQKQTQSSRRR